MATFIKQAFTYAAFRYPNGDTRQARINIHAVDGYKLYILFHADGATLPDNRYSTDHKIGTAYEHASHFSDYIDLLRNETPVWVTFSEETAWFAVYASTEPVGEGEM